MAQQFFITSSGTEIGKSFVLQKIIKEYREKKQKIHAIKPIISGFNIEDQYNDSALILKALSMQNNEQNLNLISPWRFKEPLAPNIAAKAENKEINLEEVIKFCQREIEKSQKNNVDLFIEGAGGIMAPINDKFTFLDLIKELQIPAILVVGNYLGTISHSLTAIKVMEDSNIKIAKIFLNCPKSNENLQQNLFNLENFTNIEIEVVGYELN